AVVLHAALATLSGVGGDIEQVGWRGDGRDLMIFDRDDLSGGGAVAAGVGDRPGHGRVALGELGGSVVGDVGHGAVVTADRAAEGHAGGEEIGRASGRV